MCRKGITTNLRDFYTKIIVAIIPTDLVTNSLLFSFCPFLQTRKKVRFSASWFSGNKKYFSIFCLQRVTLYFKPMPNSTNFYKEFFLHVIPVGMIVLWFLSLASLFKSVKNLQINKTEMSKLTAIHQLKCKFRKIFMCQRRNR